MPSIIDPREVDRCQQPAHDRAIARIEAETRQEGFSSLVAMLAGIMAPAAAAMGTLATIPEPRPVASSSPIPASKRRPGGLERVPTPTPRVLMLVPQLFFGAVALEAEREVVFSIESRPLRDSQGPGLRRHYRAAISHYIYPSI